jgi:hypothetical protein
MNIEPPFVIGVEVVSVNQRERATVCGSGGGGFSYKGTGFTVPVNVQTTHQKWMEVWVKRTDGREDRLDFSGVNLLVREGHKLALLMSGSQIWAVRNFSTGITTILVGPEALVGPRIRFGLRWLLSRWFLICIGGAVIGSVLLSLTGQSRAGPVAELVDILTEIALMGCLVFAVRSSRKSKKKWRSEMAEAGRLLTEGSATLETAKLNSGDHRAAIAHGW